jgi:diadenosine tetraphosphate (Ap4A) HIT family hydrolase
VVIWMTIALDQAFQPDHYNYAFLQNQDRHVHLHVFPRYAAAAASQAQSSPTLTIPITIASPVRAGSSTRPYWRRRNPHCVRRTEGQSGLNCDDRARTQHGEESAELNRRLRQPFIDVPTRARNVPERIRAGGMS